ncbi:MAG: hypothetical protein Phog2KO_38980 [Phototrophicaceae bacterium]
MMRFLVICILGLSLVIPPMQAQTTNCTGAPESRLMTGEQALVIAEGGSNLRVVPSAGAELLNIIPQNELIPVIDGPYCTQGYAWWQVTYAGDRGWVAEGVDEFYWLAPYIIQRAQIGNVRIELQPNLISNIRLERLSEPLRSQFVLEGFPVEDAQISPFIVIFDAIPDGFNINDIESNTPSQQQSLEMGSRFVDIYFDNPLQEDTVISLVYRYLALTDDNRLIDAYFPISVANLPLAYNPPETEIQDYMDDYFETTLSALDSLTDTDFSPTLAQLDSIVRSIQVNAPLIDSDSFEFSSSGIHLDYNPILATSITETVIPAENESPTHILLTFNDYPLDEGTIRIYRSEDVSGATLSTLQQILSRQPNNPPRIPVLSQPEAPLTRSDLSYLRFMTGDGVRYTAEFTEGERIYTYQGLSDNGDYFVSVMLPINDDFAPIDVLDMLVQSLQVGG